MSTNNLCFEAKIIKLGIPLHTPVLLYKSGVKGVYITRTCFHHVQVVFETLDPEDMNKSCRKTV